MRLFLSVLVLTLVACATSAPVQPPRFEDQFHKIKSQMSERILDLEDPKGAYHLLTHSEVIQNQIKLDYTRPQLLSLRNLLKPATTIAVKPNGLVQAADRPLNSLDDPTHYDAIWLRDTLWVYLGLKIEEPALARTVLLKMLSYLSSADQRKRFTMVIQDPSLVTGPEGQMNVVHIRFDGKSAEFKDIQVGGKPQKWNHKQNDALGLFYDLFLRAVAENFVFADSLTDEQYETLALFPAYFSKIKFYEMEDAGSWEEIERTNSSSVGLVTSSLESLKKLLKSREASALIFQGKISNAAKGLGLGSYLSAASVHALISQGYARIHKQLRAGGESPLYPKNGDHYRTADAALLNLIYPAQLPGLSLNEKEKILRIVDPLVGEVGIRRYFNDSYQSGNFWLSSASQGQGKPEDNRKEDIRTSDASSAEDFSARGKKFISGSEAQWFFDSWYSKVAGVMYASTGNKKFRRLQLQHFNRALAQLTGGTREVPMLGADTNPVAPFALPESYNTLAYGKERIFVPSPITPLNWAKASLAIALDGLM